MQPGAAPRLLITDLDNTLYSWVGFIVPALEAMTEAIVRTTGRDASLVHPALQEVYSEEDTTDYAFVLQKSRLYTELGLEFEEFNRQVIQPAKEAYRQARDQHLKEFPEVTSTLESFLQRGTTIVGLTDAPFFPAEQRLKALGLDKLLHGLYAMRSYRLPTGEDPEDFMVDPKILEKERQGAYRSELKRRIELDPSWEKPDPRGVRRILKDYDVTAEEAWYVGDHPVKDALAAQEAGVRFFHAGFGRQTPREIGQKLNRYSPPSLQNRHSVPADMEMPKPESTLGLFSDLLDHLD